MLAHGLQRLMLVLRLTSGLHLVAVLSVSWVLRVRLGLLSLECEVVLVASTHVLLLVLDGLFSELRRCEVLLVGADVGSLTIVVVLVVLLPLLLVWLERTCARMLLRWRHEVGVSIVVLAIHLILQLSLQLLLTGVFTRLHHQHLFKLILQLSGAIALVLILEAVLTTKSEPRGVVLVG